MQLLANILGRLNNFWKNLPWVKRIGLTILLVLISFHEGWCWGAFSRDVLFLQYMFQCNCLPFTEAIRYQPSKVLSSACTNPELIDVSPSQRFALIAELGPESAGLVHRLNLINLETHTQRAIELSDHIKLPRQLGFRFVDENLILVLNTIQGESAYLVNLDNNIWSGVSVINYRQSLNVEQLQALKNAEKVVQISGTLIRPGTGPILSVAHEYALHPEQNLYFYTSNSYSTTQLLKELADAGVVYETFPSPSAEFYPTIQSPDSEYWANTTGIYRTQSQEPVIKSNLKYLGARYWIGNRAVIYDTLGWLYLIRGDNVIMLPQFHVAQPILFLEVP